MSGDRPVQVRALGVRATVQTTRPRDLGVLVLVVGLLLSLLVITILLGSPATR
jgi:hypothetical protein